MANGTQVAVWADLQSNPLGNNAGENMGMPINYRIPTARVYVINHSRTRSWKRLKIPVSTRRGAEEALAHDKKLRELYNVDMLYKRAEQRDVSIYETGVYAAPFAVRVPGGPNGKMGSLMGRNIVVMPADSSDDKPKAVEVPEGTWDLYLGNYERMRSEDPHIVQEEVARLAQFWQNRHNPVFRYTDDGETTDMNNEYGVLEFVRVSQKIVTEPIDKAFLSALDIVET